MFEPEELMERIVDLEAQLKVSEMAPPAAEQLIACLEGEIAKRDARIVELEDLGAEWVNKALAYSSELSAIKAQYLELAALSPSNPLAIDAPVAKPQVVMPERSNERGSDGELTYEAVAHNRCLDCVARLNAAPAPVCKTCADSGCDPAFKALVPCSGCAAAPVQQVSVADGLREDAERCAFVLRQIASMDAEDIDSDDIDLRFEDANGFDTGCDVSIVDYAEKAANVIDAMLAAAPAAPAADALYEAVTPDVVEWLRCGLAANNRLVDGTHPALERVRAALAAHRAAPAPGGE